VAQKYGGDIVFPFNTVLDHADPSIKRIVCASLSRNTWNKHKSAWNCLDKFSVQNKIDVKWPIAMAVWIQFVIWTVLECRLKPSTVRDYIYSLKLAHELKGVSFTCPLKNRLVSMFLEGAKNLGLSSEPSNFRRAANLPLLKLLGHRIALSSWPEGCKQVVWSALTLGFFTGVRFGEILAECADGFDSSRTLLWQNVLFQADRILIFVRSPKVRKAQGDFLDLFEEKVTGCCAFSALSRLRKIQLAGGYSDGKNPVFCFPSGDLLTCQMLNKILSTMLSDICEVGKNTISCHSFRAAVASSLTNKGEATAAEIKTWGRWSSDCYKLYARANTESKRKMFNLILDSM